MPGDLLALRIQIRDTLGSKAERVLQPLAEARLAFGRLMVLAFLLQVFAVYGLSPEAPGLARKAIVVGSYLMLGFAVWSNRRQEGMLLLGLGLGLNLLATAANGGLMPVSPEAMLLADRAGWLESLAAGQWVPASKDVLLPLAQTAFSPFTDVLVYRSALGGSYIFSIGDVLIALGLLRLAAGLLSTKRRTT